MPGNPYDREFHHALRVLEDQCIGCTHCMTACPTRAIRVRNGKAIIDPGRCVDCGECAKACPVSAIIVEQDDLQMIHDYPVRAVLVPGVMIGQFPGSIAVSDIYSALREIGFTHIYEVESTVPIVLEAYAEFRQKNSLKPLISSFCPAIVRLIQVRFPSLTGNILRAKPPIDMAAALYREKLVSEGIASEDIGMFYITPCAAKIAAVKSPVGEEKSAVNGVINMKFLYNRILQIVLQNSASQQKEQEYVKTLNPSSILWSLTRGETRQAGGRALAIDGIHNVSEFLEKFENDEITDVDFLELRACDESCAGGLLINGNRFLTVERMNKRSEDYQKESDKCPGFFRDLSIKSINDRFFEEVRPRPVERLDVDILVALRKMERKRRLMCFLPGFDCAACGSPDCQTLSEDTVQGKAQVSNCIFLQQTMMEQGKLSLSHALEINGKIWGQDRLLKNCNKIGAEDENQ